MRSKTKLPILNSSKIKSLGERDRLKLDHLLTENSKNRFTHKDYRYDEDFRQTKAANFVSRIDTVDSPDLIFAVSDHL